MVTVVHLTMNLLLNNEVTKFVLTYHLITYHIENLSLDNLSLDNLSHWKLITLITITLKTYHLSHWKHIDNLVFNCTLHTQLPPIRTLWSVGHWCTTRGWYRWQHECVRLFSGRRWGTQKHPRSHSSIIVTSPLPNFSNHSTVSSSCWYLYCTVLSPGPYCKRWTTT